MSTTLILNCSYILTVRFFHASCQSDQELHHVSHILFTHTELSWCHVFLSWPSQQTSSCTKNLVFSHFDAHAPCWFLNSQQEVFFVISCSKPTSKSSSWSLPVRGLLSALGTPMVSLPLLSDVFRPFSDVDLSPTHLKSFIQFHFARCSSGRPYSSKENTDDEMVDECFVPLPSDLG